jgi:hypothetical protein
VGKNGRGKSCFFLGHGLIIIFIGPWEGDVRENKKGKSKEYLSRNDIEGEGEIFQERRARNTLLSHFLSNLLRGIFVNANQPSKMHIAMD